MDNTNDKPDAFSADLTGVSDDGRAVFDAVRAVALNLAGTARGFLDEGQELEPVFFFIIVNDGGGVSVGMLPAVGGDKDDLAAMIRRAAEDTYPTAVLHVIEGWTLWRPMTKIDVDEIRTEYGGQVSKHPEAVDCAVFQFKCVIAGHEFSAIKQFRVDVGTRMVVDEKPWLVSNDGRSDGRLCVPTELFKGIA